ncbi:MAG TPA: hypothetical protein VK619_17515 [Pyrinomonadaceae bacterium]|nr:hypothetical protein [Pyrinomonadaceae bacterium]
MPTNFPRAYHALRAHLLSYSAGVNALSEDGRTPPGMAAENRYKDIADILRGQDSPESS